jgi:hypothetical protein
MKKNHSNVELGQLMQESESLVKGLRANPEVDSLLKEGKEHVLNLLSQEGNLKLDAASTKDMLSKGKNVLKTVATSEQGQNIARTSKFLCLYNLRWRYLRFFSGKYVSQTRGTDDDNVRRKDICRYDVQQQISFAATK